MKLSVEIPFVIHANDYHEFEDLQRTLQSLAGVKLKYKELDGDDYGTYYAVFYRGPCPDRETIDRLYESQPI